MEKESTVEEVPTFLSTLSLRRATAVLELQCIPGRISIHALLAESDFCKINTRGREKAISIHALLAESDWTALNRP